MEETVYKFAKTCHTLFAHPTPYILAAQEQPVRKEKPPDVKSEKLKPSHNPVYNSVHNSFIVLPPSHGSSSKENWVIPGSADTIEVMRRMSQPKEMQRREDKARHREQVELELIRGLRGRTLGRVKCRKTKRRNSTEESDDFLPSHGEYDSACSTCDEDSGCSDFFEEGDNYSGAEHRSVRLASTHPSVT